MKDPEPVTGKISKDVRMRMVTYKVEVKPNRRQSAFCMIYMSKMLRG
jgi:hypothetical protein